jgi:CMP-N-acetylneuraminic acid synthetase/regulator of RNase E activity RraA
VKKKVIAFLPVKGGSERIKNKNTQYLDGKPLFLHTLQKLMRCDFLDEVYLDSESEEIFNLAADIPCKKMLREKALATNKTDGHALFYNEVKHAEADVYVQILCTSPFIEIDTIREAVRVVCEGAHDSVVLVRREKQYHWDGNTLRPKYNSENIPNSNDLEDTVIETMGLYVVARDIAVKSKKRIGETPYLLNAKPVEAIDVNYPDDFALASLIAAGVREKVRELLTNLSKQLTSSMISDVLNEMGVTGKVISKLTPNIRGKKIFGRAKTLKICAVENGSADSSIYDALNSYLTVVPNDVIVVHTDLPEFAYFGELNANLAMRSGAVGAIIGGKTRDSTEVSRLDFPVFSTGYTCEDIKNNGTVESINRTIFPFGVEVAYEDLIFGDGDGVVVIPQVIESQVLEKCMEVIRNESQILLDVARGVSIETIRNSYGDF